MQLDRFTIKSQEALAAAVRLAQERRSPQIAPAHLLAVLLEMGAPAGAGADVATADGMDSAGGVVLAVLAKLLAQLDCFGLDSADRRGFNLP
jgi:hypothetical protein